MPSVVTVLATLIGDDVQHGLTRNRFMTASGGLPVAADVDTALAAQGDFWEAVHTLLPPGIVVQGELESIVLDEATGLTTAAVPGTTAPAPIDGAAPTEAHVSGTGGRVSWRTGIRRGSREVRGATFVVPLTGSAFTTGGNLTTGTVAILLTAAGDYLAAMSSGALIPVVYGRPLPASAHHGALAGLAAPITASDVSAVPAFLRRRRS